MKIVINTCYGGFGLSEEAMLAYAERKGLTLYPEKGVLVTTYWTVPPEERVPDVTSQQWTRMSQSERADHNDAYKARTIQEYQIDRDDPDLVAVVEELGERANGECASLRVVSIPSGIEWEIAEYDELERVAESHRTWG